MERKRGVTDCPFNNFAYRWRAVGAEGRACVDRGDGDIHIFTERRWTAPARP